MKREITSDVISRIDDKFVFEAAEYMPRRRRFSVKAAGIAAACIIAAAAAGVILMNRPKEIKTETPQAESILPRPYKQSYHLAESAVVWPWEYKTDAEKYTEVEFDGKSYHICSGGTVSDMTLIGKGLGECTLSGYDDYSDKTYTENAEAFEVSGGDSSMIIAVKLESGYGIYRELKTAVGNARLDSLLERLGLAGRLKFTHFTDSSGKTFALENGGELVRMLTEVECQGGELGADSPMGKDSSSITFTADCPELGVSNRAFSVSAEGRIFTNIFDYGYQCFISKEDAERIIAYAKAHSAEERDTGRTDMIGGRVTEIGEGYIKIDDTVLCEDESEGMTFTVPTEDIRIRRCMEFSPKPKTGDIVAVYFRGEVTGDGRVGGAYGIVSASLSEEGEINIPE